MLLEVKGLQVAYDDALAIDDVGFTLDAGQFITIIGANGAGKTTTLNALMGLVGSRAGSVVLDGEDISSLSPDQRVARGLVLVPEGRELFARFSVEDNLKIGAFVKRRDGAKMKSSLDRVYAILPKLKERRSQIAGTLSGGEQQMVALGRALMSEPRVLMLDEPSTGLAPLVVQEIFAAISSLKSTGMTSVLVEQNVQLALDVADHGYVIEVGRIVMDGPSAELKQDERVRASYLGGRQQYSEDNETTERTDS